MEEIAAKKSFKDTLNLPTTPFPIRPNSAERDPEIIARWESHNLYPEAMALNNGNDRFVLHDGPPYANGHLHLGHALNKILKDIVSKSQRMAGKHVKVTPGWDCHGLPIELKMTAEMGETDASKLDKKAFKAKCREYAQKWIGVQREEFKRLGVIMDWDKPYTTMAPSYEGMIVKAFSTFVKKGFIERKGKTIPWCASCKTALATAEIEYKDRKDPSCFIYFQLTDDSVHKLFPHGLVAQGITSANFLIWTTTPWTIPLNRAVMIHPTATYQLLQAPVEGKAFMVAAELADKMCTLLQVEKKVIAEIPAEQLKGLTVHHPIEAGRTSPVILDQSVLLADGTACVHSAPGCGPEDYLVGLKNGLEIYSPLTADGKYSAEIKPAELAGTSVADGQGWVIKTLLEKGTLAHKGSINHSYPHCWRCRNGLMFRATDQWFCNLEQHDLVKNALEEIDKITFYPEWGKARFQSFIGSRTEWCISRQRQWGVPIPALLCSACNGSFISTQLVEKVAEGIGKEGIEYWDRVTMDELTALGALDGACCDRCGNKDLNQFIKEDDILDVWFDSGVSSYAVLSQDPEQGVPASMYLEGSDQHRGWFQSSMLAGMVLYEQRPMNSILTHGFIVDEDRKKMSKSLGNGVEPQEVIKKFGTDVLRLWVASADVERDVVISEQVLSTVAESFRKIRNTCRFMLSNLFDYDHAQDAVSIDNLWTIDRYALMQLHDLNHKVRAAYAEFKFTAVYQLINAYCINELSAFYLDILKDRLYVEKKDGLPRRSGQTVLHHILDTVTRLMAPILSFAAEEISDHYQTGKATSIHLQSFPQLGDLDQLMQQATKEHGVWAALEQVRDVVLKAIELKREVGEVKLSLEAKVTLYLDESTPAGTLIAAFMKELSLHEKVSRFFKEWLIVSQVSWVQSPAGLNATALPWVLVSVEHAHGAKCPRCWQWDTHQHPDGLCKRCDEVLS